ncbi:MULTISPECIES: CPBP family intramembrane glutamic endopeptidase [unclassified Rhodococcus (in: high G+C Gram-positive bacteria)]|uniref:CPBP family intramembrane glutamic endopeptidase n=1 Tax=unclassified Rhodococcus (in: high G+C Gram-positive bacteria) TaxID=192944 RepID=UPI002955CE55|nr:type II CAAX endopeptidase family protein [Rhodococcus sp. IEGM 1343]MDV8055252.1 type II CAAX endopeptidase family protein [Rhodococcus sp. IEGM 1343]
MTDPGDGAGRADPDRTSWAGLAPMNHVHQQGSGLSETYWRAEQAALERRRGQRWGLPAAALVLGLNLAGFLVLGLVVTSDASAVFVVGIMIPSLLATGVAVAISKSRGNGPVVDFGLPRSIPEFLGHLRSGLAWGGVAVVGGIVLALILLSRIEVGDPTPLGTVTDTAVGLKIVLALWIWLGAPICEETMFRGMLWGALEKRTRPMPMAWLGNRWVVLAITAVLFAVWHREWWRLVVLLWGGFAIGIARMRSGSIVASITAHSLNNTLPALVVLLA